MLGRETARDRGKAPETGRSWQYIGLSLLRGRCTMWSLAHLRGFVHFDFGTMISSPSVCSQAAGVALPTSQAPRVSDSALAQVACMRALNDQIDERASAELL